MKKVLYALLIICVLALLSVGVFLFQQWQWLNTPLNLADDQRHVVVQPGEHVYALAERLSYSEAITKPIVWRIYARYVNKAPIKAGEFMLAADATPIEILEKLQSNDVVQHQVTLVEGLTFQDFIVQLSKHKNIQSALLGLSVQEQLKKLNLDIDHPEGWFYPDTYQFTSGTTDSDILVKAHAKLRQVLDQEWAQREQNLPYENSYEALIMASIIEKETGVASERAEIAGVFVRRLQKGMRLQTDPTVIYGLGPDFDGNITRKHLKQPTPYNTYTIKGLPPTPIANAGRAAIHAALHPKPGKTLYFVGKGDGTHYFSETLEEHNRAVNKYQRFKRAENYRSAPPKAQ